MKGIVVINNQAILFTDEETVAPGDVVYWNEFEGKLKTVRSIDLDYVWFTDGTCLRIHHLIGEHQTLFKVIKQFIPSDND